MARSGLHDETKDARWPVHVAGIERQRVTPTVEAVLEYVKPALLTKTDFAHDSILLGCLGYLLYNGRWEDLYRTLGRLLGLDGTSVPTPDTRPIPISDGAMRELAGVRKPTR